MGSSGVVLAHIFRYILNEPVLAMFEYGDQAIFVIPVTLTSKEGVQRTLPVGTRCRILSTTAPDAFGSCLIRVGESTYSVDIHALKKVRRFVVARNPLWVVLAVGLIGLFAIFLLYEFGNLHIVASF